MGYPSNVKTKSKKAPASKKPAAGRKPAAGSSLPAKDNHDHLDADLHSVLKHVAPPQAKDEAEAKEPIDEWVSVSCPFCAELIELHVTEEEAQTHNEDCENCGRGVSMHITIDEEREVHVEAFRS